MLDKDVLTRDTIRMLISEIKRFEIDNKAEASEETILSIIQKMVKQRNDSIELIINDVIKSTNAETMQDMGKVMGAAKSQLQGKADMSLVSNIVKQLLSG